MTAYIYIFFFSRRNTHKNFHYYQEITCVIYKKKNLFLFHMCTLFKICIIIYFCKALDRYLRKYWWFVWNVISDDLVTRKGLLHVSVSLHRESLLQVILSKLSAIRFVLADFPTHRRDGFMSNAPRRNKSRRGSLFDRVIRKQ